MHALPAYEAAARCHSLSNFTSLRMALLDYPFDFSEKIGYDAFMPAQLKLLFLASEVAPFAKTGGLADVTGSLPLALKSSGLDVRVCLPFYRCVQQGGFQTRLLHENLEIPLARTGLPANIRETRLEEQVPVYLIEREDLYDRPNLYANEQGDYYDNLERFSFFSHSALRLCEAIGFEPDIIHCHDWQTGLVPALLKGCYQNNPALARARTLFTIHNLGYQGLFPAEKLVLTGLRPEAFFHFQGLEFWGQVSLLKAGIVYAEQVSTVSPSYAGEIQTFEFGLSMEGLLRYYRDKLQGILNGADYRLWDPAHDPHLAAQYRPSRMAGKALCKKALLKELDLEAILEKKPLFAMISRLSVQKGLDLLIDVLDDLMSLGCGLIVEGIGDPLVRQALEKGSARYPGRMRFINRFDDPLAHRIMAGADIFLLPSQYEPCGLTQMYAMKYGTVPVGRAVGGLNDTIQAFEAETGLGNGFKFRAFESATFLETLRQALDLFAKPQVWKKIIHNAMLADFSWQRSAGEYLQLYERLIEKAEKPPLNQEETINPPSKKGSKRANDQKSK